MRHSALTASESFRDWLLLFSFLAVQTVQPTYSRNFPLLTKVVFSSKLKTI